MIATREIARELLNKCMTSIHLALRDVSRVLDVAAYRIQYALVTGQVEEPRIRVANNRIFQAQDLIRLAKHFRRPVPEICFQEEGPQR